MQIISLDQLQSMVDMSSAIEVVQQAFIDRYKGLIEQPSPMQILFTEADGSFFGDCHVKAAQKKQGKYFVIKIASGFYQNATKGLPTNNGMVIVMSAETGQPVALLQDEGWLTQMRTAAAGAVAASLKPVSNDACLGIIGTGEQAYLQALFTSSHLDLKRVAVYGRNMKKVQQLCSRLAAEHGLNATAQSSVKEVCHGSQIVITTTSSTEPLINKQDVPKELHIVAMGTDSPGKNEIHPEVTQLADIIVTDDHNQCRDHGDFGVAVRALKVAENADISLGQVLSSEDEKSRFSQAGISLVDLTGLGAQDLAIASVIDYER